MNQLNQRSKDNLNGVHPDLLRLIENAIADCPIPFIIIYGVRTTVEQRTLYSQGRTKPGAIVTSCDGVTKKSNHQVKNDGYGHAVDILADANRNDKVDQVEIADAKSLIIVADHIKKKAKELNIPIDWGGDWKMRDYPHFELKI